MCLHSLAVLLIAILITVAPEARAAAGAVSPCVTAPSSATELTSYHDARVGDDTRYFVNVVRDPRTEDWSPARWIDMPRHHSTALDWLESGAESLACALPSPRARGVSRRVD